MPEFLAVECFQCAQFQVQQRRQDGKFACRLCGARQSVRRVHARSRLARDVRVWVQARNLARGAAEEAYDARPASPPRPATPPPRAPAAAGDDADRAPSRWAAHAARARAERDGLAPWQAAECADDARARPCDDGGPSDDDGRFVTALPDSDRGGTRLAARRRAPGLSRKRKERTGVRPQLAPFERDRRDVAGREGCEGVLALPRAGPPPRKQARDHAALSVSHREEKDVSECENGFVMAAPGDAVVEDEVIY